MEPDQKGNASRSRFYWAWGIGIAIIALFSGAAYPPLLIYSPSVEPLSPLFAPAVIAPPQAPEMRTAVLKKHPQKSRLTRRLNDRYRIGRSVRASA